MKPGNLRKQGAKSGGSDRKMREENLRAPQSGAFFDTLYLLVKSFFIGFIQGRRSL